MIEKLRSRGPVDVPYTWKRSPGIIGVAFTLLGLFVAATLFGALAIGGLADPNIALLIAGGFGGLVVAFGVLSALATRAEA